jgi:hypothetical protein
MGFMENLLKGTLCVANLILVAGIVGAALGDAERAFDLTFWLAAHPPSGQPLEGAVAQLTANSGCSPSPQARVLSVEQAESLQQQWLQGAQFQDFAQVEQVLGQPACRTATELVYEVNNQGRLVFAAAEQGITLAWLPSLP